MSIGRATSQRPSAEASLRLWREYHETSDARVRDRLVLTFAPMVKYIVYKKMREIPARCEVDDFMSCGLEALIRSIDRYDPDKGATLEQFAWTRVHGAVLDELRRHDWAPRSLRRWQRDIDRARASFHSLHGRRPARPELADALAVSTSELQRRLDEIALAEVTSLNTLIGGDEDTAIERIDTLPSADRGLDPEFAASREDAKVRFRSAFARLPKREREVATMLYVHDFTLREIGEVIGVTESRVCQIHGELRRRLHTMLLADDYAYTDVA